MDSTPRIIVDLGELLDVLDTRLDTMDHFLDRVTGKILVYQQELSLLEVDDAGLPEWEREQLATNRAIDDDESNRYIFIEPVSSDESFRWMEDYCSTVKDDALRGKLQRALREKQPFRRFKDELSKSSQGQDPWYRFHREKLERYAREWIKSENLAVELRKSDGSSNLP